MDKNEYRKKQRLYLTLIILITFLLLGVLTILIFLNNPLEMQLTLFLIAGIAALVPLLILKRKFDLATFSYKHKQLFLNLEPGIVLEKNILNNDWIDFIKTQGFINYRSHGSYHMFYKIDDGINEKRSQRTLFVILLIMDEKISFENQQMSNLINGLEKTISKKKRYKNRVIYQFKSGQKFTQEKSKSTNYILFANQNSYNIVLINLYYFIEDNVAYFVHSNKFPPTDYYKFATETIIKLIKY